MIFLVAGFLGGFLMFVGVLLGAAITQRSFNSFLTVETIEESDSGDYFPGKDQPS